jgi:hypothetical protein
MLMGARLSLITGNSSYIQQAQTTYGWVKASGLISADNTVYDGLDVDQKCGINVDVHSYQTGTLTGIISHPLIIRRLSLDVSSNKEHCIAN